MEYERNYLEKRRLYEASKQGTMVSVVTDENESKKPYSRERQHQRKPKQKSLTKEDYQVELKRYHSDKLNPYESGIFTISKAKLFNLQSTFIDSFNVSHTSSRSELDVRDLTLTNSTLIQPAGLQPLCCVDNNQLVLYVDTTMTTATSAAIGTNNYDVCSLDSGFNSYYCVSHSTSTRLSSPSPTVDGNMSYFVLAQTATAPVSLFRYLVDLGSLVTESFLKWSALSACKLKQSFISHLYAASVTNSSDRLTIAYNYTSRVNTRRNQTTRLVVQKPFSLFGLLSKLNVFNLFSKANSPSTSSTSSSTSTKFYTQSPLRQFFLRLFDINFL